MLTRRQKNSIRGFTAALTCCALLSAFLIYTNISNASEAVPVVFSDILEGAVAYADDDDGGDYPVITLASEELFETMFSAELAAFTLDPAIYSSDPYGGTRRDNRATLRLPDYTDDTVTANATDNNFPPPEGMLTVNDPDFNGHAWEDADDTTVSSSPKSDTLPTGFTTPENFSAEATDDARQSVDTTLSSSSEQTLTSSETSTASSAVTPTETSSTTSVTTTTTAPPTTTTTTAPTSKTTARSTSKTTAKSTTSHTEKTPFTNVGGGKFYEQNDVYLTLFSLVNEARREAGVSELWYSARLHEVCKVRTVELTSYYSHNRPDGTRFSTALKEKGITYNKCGENIAYGRNMFKTPEEVFQAWMDSESHRENILNPDYNCVAFGLSILVVGNDTYYYWAQEFANL